MPDRAAHPSPHAQEAVLDELLGEMASQGRVFIELTSAQRRLVASSAGPLILGRGLGDLVPPRVLTADALEAHHRAELESGRLSRSLLRGLLILSLYATTDPQEHLVGVSEVARRLALNPSTAHRYIHTLAVYGALRQDASSQRYRLAR